MCYSFVVPPTGKIVSEPILCLGSKKYALNLLGMNGWQLLLAEAAPLGMAGEQGRMCCIDCYCRRVDPGSWCSGAMTHGLPGVLRTEVGLINQNQLLRSVRGRYFDGTHPPSLPLHPPRKRLTFELVFCLVVPVCSNAASSGRHKQIWFDLKKRKCYLVPQFLSEEQRSISVRKSQVRGSLAYFKMAKGR